MNGVVCNMDAAKILSLGQYEGIRDVAFQSYSQNSHFRVAKKEFVAQKVPLWYSFILQKRLDEPVSYLTLEFR